jgi:hypothetical protein
MHKLAAKIDLNLFVLSRVQRGCCRLGAVDRALAIVQGAPNFAVSED